MSSSRGLLAQRARLAFGLRGFLRDRTARERGLDELRRRFESREERFLESARKLIYEHPASPYRPLLESAGCELGDLAASVRSAGVEATLRQLRDEGVHVTHEEFKARGAIAAFDSPLFLGRGMRLSSSGSGGPRTRVTFDWAQFAEEAADELLVYEAHGLARAPLALWLPAPPGAAGIRNVLLNARIGRPPEAWFTPGTLSLGQRLRAGALIGAARLGGTVLPRPRSLPPERASVVARWLAAGNGERRVVSAFSSLAVRVAAAALETGLDLTGNVVFATGEPLSDARRTSIEESGLRTFSRYVTAETGLIGAGCPHGQTADEMHVFEERISLIEGVRSPEAALVTSLSPAAGRVLLNVELGDSMRLERRPCKCLFGELGLAGRVAGVRSRRTFTAEGATVLAAELEEIVSAVLAEAGGAVDSFRLAETRDADGLAHVELVVDPRVPLDDTEVRDRVLEALARSSASGGVAAALWREAGTVRVRREEPKLSEGAKLLPVVADRR